jgi:hypothetical protein
MGMAVFRGPGEAAWSDCHGDGFLSEIFQMLRKAEAERFDDRFGDRGAVRGDDVPAIDDRTTGSAEMPKRTRLSMIAIEERALRAETELNRQAQLNKVLEREMRALKSEHERVGQRVKRLLTQLDEAQI